MIKCTKCGGAGFMLSEVSLSGEVPCTECGGTGTNMDEGFVAFVRTLGALAPVFSSATPDEVGDTMRRVVSSPALRMLAESLARGFGYASQEKGDRPDLLSALAETCGRLAAANCRNEALASRVRGLEAFRGGVLGTVGLHEASPKLSRLKLMTHLKGLLAIERERRGRNYDDEQARLYTMEARLREYLADDLQWRTGGHESDPTNALLERTREDLRAILEGSSKGEPLDDDERTSD